MTSLWEGAAEACAVMRSWLSLAACRERGAHGGLWEGVRGACEQGEGQQQEEEGETHTCIFETRVVSGFSSLPLRPTAVRELVLRIGFAHLLWKWVRSFVGLFLKDKAP